MPFMVRNRNCPVCLLPFLLWRSPALTRMPPNVKAEKRAADRKRKPLVLKMKTIGFQKRKTMKMKMEMKLKMKLEMERKFRLSAANALRASLPLPSMKSEPIAVNEATALTRSVSWTSTPLRAVKWARIRWRTGKPVSERGNGATVTTETAAGTERRLNTTPAT